MVMKLTGVLEKTFGTLPKTLFFEVQTIRALRDYFMVHHVGQLQALLGEIIQLERAPLPVSLPSAASTKRGRRRVLRRMGSTASASQIAIIGLSGRYPGSPTLEAYWENLRSGQDCISEIPLSRWDHSVYFDPDEEQEGKTNSKWGGFIEGVDTFDPLFFGISPREAELLDPQERIFLECVYATLEDAGYTRGSLASRQSGHGLSGNVGVFVGVMYEEYQLYGAQSQMQGRGIALGGNPSSIANRVSYYCNWIGPSMAVDTMCSSSLTALHLACHSIRSEVCDMAIAGGVNVSVHPNKYLLLSQDNFTSSNGRCMSFGVGGDGYVPGEGVGAVLLKRLSEAQRDGDHVYGVVLGSAENHGGRANSLTAPNVKAQSALLQAAYQDAGIAPQTVGYIEAHGTGTPLGDPVEINSLKGAFEGLYEQAGVLPLVGHCGIGSVKTNIGHLELAAGIAGVIKVLLQLRHKRRFASLHCDTINPYIELSDSPFYIVQEAEDWQALEDADGGFKAMTVSGG